MQQGFDRKTLSSAVEVSETPDGADLQRHDPGTRDRGAENHILGAVERVRNVERNRELARACL